MKSKIENELNRLLQEGEEFGDLDKSPEAWERQVRHLIDNYLGPKVDPPPNAHSQGYYDFIFSDSHAAKVAVLRTVLFFDKPVNTNQQESSIHEKSKKGKKRYFDFHNTKGIVELAAALIAIITGLIAFAKWLL